jgi:hypothetical protein
MEYVGFALAGVALAGCLPSPWPEVPPMCITTADCAAGKICAEGLCWGNPPDGQFAAVLMPPSEGWPELATTEIPALSIAANGWIENLHFAETALIAGRVVLACSEESGCDSQASIEAQISFVKPSTIPGRPDTTRTVTSVAGITGSEPSFTVALPLSDVPYRVLVVPSRSASAMTAPDMDPSALAPPLRTCLDVSEAPAGSYAVEWALGDPLVHKVALGRVIDAAERGMAGMQVMATGESAGPALSCEPGGPAPTGRSSSIATTDADGYFSLRIPRGMNQLDLVATSVEPGLVPTLLVTGVEIPDPEYDEPVELSQRLQMPITQPPEPFVIPVRGLNSNGVDVPVRGAAVRFTTELLGLTSNTRAIFSASTFTNETGHAALDLIPGNVMQGNRGYVVSVEPLPSSEHATLHDHTVEVGPEQGLLASIQLQRRVAVGGMVHTAEGLPAFQAVVAARIAPGFREALSPGARAVVDNLQLPSASTDTSGRFVLWLDDELGAKSAIYDLEITLADPLEPMWTVRNIDMSTPTGTGVLELPGITMPAASYARGLVLAPAASPDAQRTVPQASLRLYEILDQDTCGSSPCPRVAIFRGQSTSREDGLIRLILPDTR